MNSIYQYKSFNILSDVVPLHIGKILSIEEIGEVKVEWISGKKVILTKTVVDETLKQMFGSYTMYASGIINKGKFYNIDNTANQNHMEKIMIPDLKHTKIVLNRRNQHGK